MNLVVPFVETVQVLEFVVSVWCQPIDFDNLTVWIVHHTILLLVERQHLLLLSLKFTAQLSSFEDLLTQLLVTVQRFHAVKGA